MILNLINTMLISGEEEISVDATEALVTVGRVGQVVNIVVATIEHLDWSWIVLGVA